VAVKEMVVAKATQSYLIVGGQEADNISGAMTKQGIVARALVLKDWKVKADSVSTLVEQTKKAIEEERPSTIILCSMEQSVYQAQTEEGNNMPITKNREGELHVEGELGVCGREAQLKLFKLMEPIWKMATDIKLVAMCPFLQYITDSCCGEEGHITNRKHQNFESKLRSGLNGFKQNLKMYLHTGGHHHCRVMDPLVDTKDMNKEEMGRMTQPGLRQRSLERLRRVSMLWS
jgi:hypothetical protein